MPAESTFLRLIEHDEPRGADLRAAAAEGGVLLDRAIDVARRAAEAQTLSIAEERLLLYGLFLVADREEARLFQPLMRILRSEGSARDLVMSEEVLDLLPAVVVAVFDGDWQTFATTALDPATDDLARMGLLSALGQLVVRGLVERELALALLEQVEASGLAAPGTGSLVGWIDAVAALGAFEFFAGTAARLEQAAAREQDPEIRASLREAAEQMAAAAADDAADDDDPALSPVFDDDRPLVERVAAMMERAERRAELHVPTAGVDADDPAEEHALDDDEFEWLAGFLAREDLPGTAMDIEMLDGFCTGRAAAGLADAPMWPTVILGKRPETLWRMRNGTDLDRLAALAGRMERAVRLRFAEGLASEPLLLEPFPDEREGRNWSSGFVEGVLGNRTLEEVGERDPELAKMLEPLLLLAGASEPISEAESEKIVDALPALALGLHRLLARRAGARSAEAPRAKVGRNDPCPCGSGRKYKHCCGRS